MKYTVISDGDYPDFIFKLLLDTTKTNLFDIPKVKEWCDEYNVHVVEQHSIQSLMLTFLDEETYILFKLTWA